MFTNHLPDNEDYRVVFSDCVTQSIFLRIRADARL